VDSVGGWVCERRGASEGGKKKKKWVGAGVDKKSDAVAALKFSLWVFFFPSLWSCLVCNLKKEAKKGKRKQGQQGELRK
jgi:hypothetical protein